MHPTFKPSIIKVDKDPFIISRTGWGYFTIVVYVEFHAWTDIKKLRLEHELCLEDNGKSNSFLVELDQELIKNNLESSLAAKFQQMAL